MEWLKEFLGDELYAQVEPKLKAAGDKVKVGNLAGGAYVGKDKFDAMEARAKAAESSVTERDTQLTALKALKPEELAAKITELETKNANDAKAYKEQMDAMRQETAITSYLGGHKFTSNLARDAVAAKLKAAALKMADDGKLIGADDIMATIKKDNPGAFEAAPARQFGPNFGSPQGGQNQPPAGSMKEAIAAHYAAQGLNTGARGGQQMPPA